MKFIISSSPVQTATIKFNSDYSGNVIIKGAAENNTGNSFATHSVELETE